MFGRGFSVRAFLRLAHRDCRASFKKSSARLPGVLDINCCHFRFLSNYITRREHVLPCNIYVCNIDRRSHSMFKDQAKSVMKFYEFAEAENKNKETFLEMISLYEKNFRMRKGVVDFIYAALTHMKEFGVHEDLETYKKLIGVMPKGKYVASNVFQIGGMYHPREQECMIKLLCAMEDNGVMPDPEVGEMLKNIFGEHVHPNKKFYRMMYWMPKFNNKSPFLLPKPIPNDLFILGKLAIEKITGVDLQNEICVFRTEEVEASVDKTWIVSGQSPKQRELLECHSTDKPVIVEGGDYVYIGKHRINYFVLKSEDVHFEFTEPESVDDVSNMQSRYFNPNFEEKPERSLHEQEDGVIYAVCTTGTSGKDSLLSWIRLLQEHGNPRLKDLAVLFRFKRAPHQPVPLSTSVAKTEEKEGMAHSSN